VERKILSPRRESNPTTPNVKPVAQRNTFGSRKRRGISLLADWLLASQGGLCSMELFS